MCATLLLKVIQIHPDYQKAYRILSMQCHATQAVLWTSRVCKGCKCNQRLERGGTCWLLKLRWMGTQRVQIKGVLLWLIRRACRAYTRDFYSALAALVGPVQNSFPHRTLFQCLCPHCQASWASSRAGLPISKYVSLVVTLGTLLRGLRSHIRMTWLTGSQLLSSTWLATEFLYLSASSSY